jgi:hypothetical protein
MPAAAKQKPTLPAAAMGSGGEVAAPKRKRGNPKWHKGMPRPEGAGRSPGVPNKFTKAAEDILIAAAAAVGRDGKGDGDFLGYLSETARLHRPEEKVRLCLTHLDPVWRPPCDMVSMKVVNLENGSTITGDVGDSIGRGGRKTLYFVDEAAHLEHPEMVEAALSENTRVRIDISSVAGLGNVFHRKREAATDW